ncbi:hypothetical protein ACSNOK_31265 [Streptomyces sp. URMC 126]|uniref:hypothetical protein n=1 Tax=Streptomyces sp. URMC 126 TaxID=3423401 RepID=UPI003F1DED4D
MPEYTPPAGLPARLLGNEELRAACGNRDFATIFRMAKRAGIYPALIGRCCQLTPSRVAEIANGRRRVVDIQVVERIADGLRIPGSMLGLAPRAWERERMDDMRPVPFGPSAGNDFGVPPVPAGSVEEVFEPALVVQLAEAQLEQHCRYADFFGSRHILPLVIHQTQTIVHLLETATGPLRTALLRTGARAAELIGWLHQDLGDLVSASYWSDRSMEWAQEAADDRMQAYVLVRKSNQAAALSQGAKTVALARAAQRLPSLPPRLTALAKQQEAQGYCLMRNLRAAQATFDEAHAFASRPDDTGRSSGFDTSYCTPEYIEIQRATYWTGLGEPAKAITAFQAQLSGLSPMYRNDRGVYLARLARAHAAERDYEQSFEVASRALAIASQTGSVRTITELSAVAATTAQHGDCSGNAAFLEHFRAVRDHFSAGHSRPGTKC